MIVLVVSIALGLIAGYVGESLRRTQQWWGLAGLAVLTVAAIILWENVAKADLGPWYAYFAAAAVVVGLIGQVIARPRISS